MSDKIWFDPTSDKWALSDGEHYLEVPHWAREIIVNEFERETRQLKTENAKLRDGAYAMRQLYEDELKHALVFLEAADTICELQTENAKLRELLSVMAYCNQFRRDCDGYSMNGAAGIITERAGCDELLDRLRELGAEVDG